MKVKVTQNLVNVKTVKRHLASCLHKKGQGHLASC